MKIEQWSALMAAEARLPYVFKYVLSDARDDETPCRIILLIAAVDAGNHVSPTHASVLHMRT